MSNRGYSKRLALANAEADDSNLGVYLGRYCIENEIPVSSVAEYFSVSRQTVYNWFLGEVEPRPDMQQLIKIYIESQGQDA